MVSSSSPLVRFSFSAANLESSSPFSSTTTPTESSFLDWTSLMWATSALPPAPVPGLRRFLLPPQQKIHLPNDPRCKILPSPYPPLLLHLPFLRRCFRSPLRVLFSSLLSLITVSRCISSWIPLLHSNFPKRVGKMNKRCLIIWQRSEGKRRGGREKMKKQEILYKHTRRRRESSKKEEGEAEGKTPGFCGR